MAVTQIADIIVPEIFTDYVQEESIRTNAFIQSGAVAVSPLLSGLLAGGGTDFAIPSWENISTPDNDYDVSSDDPTEVATPVKIAAHLQKTLRLCRNKSWAAADLAAALAGSDPLAAAAGQVARYQISQRNRTAIQFLNGYFGAASMADAVNDISGGVGSAAVISAGALIDTTAKWGDMLGMGSVIAMHSAVYRKLLKDNMIDTAPISVQGVPMTTYMGYLVIVDDRCPVDTGVYTSYIFSAGALQFGYTTPKVPVEVYRQPLQANGGAVEYLIVRDEFTFHLPGMKWVGSVAGVTATDAEIATGTNWTRVLDQKLVPAAALIHKIA